ncbi:MAG: HRDC domain-containing protein, partial [Bacteroidales bacterium]|nr:HRDC domain-containing protein [Bacteroidales bacterium]
LSPDDQYLLQQLACWREEVARERDRPRGHIVPDAVLAEVARLKPTSRGQLSRIEGFHGRSVRQYGDDLLSQLDELVVETSGPCVDFETIPEPLDREARKLIAELRQVIDRRAELLGIAPELLARKRDLELLVRSALAGHPALPEALCRGWRHDVIGKELLGHVQ